MREFFNSLFISALPEQGKRALLLMPLAAFGVLLIFLGCAELTGVESEWAGCFRLLADDGRFSGEWLPEHYSSMIFGRFFREISPVFTVNEWLIRFPAVLAALAVMAGTILLALEIFDRKIAIFAGWLLLGSYGFLYWGRVGSNAIFGAAATVWCAALFYGRMRHKSAPFRCSFDFFVLLLLTMAVCGFTAVGGIIALLLPLWFTMAKTYRFKVEDAVWCVLGTLSAVAVVGVLLYLVVYSGNPENTWLDNLVRLRSFCRNLIFSSWREFITPTGNLTKSLFHLPRLLLPWSLFIPAAVWGLWKKRELLPDDLKILICGMGLFVLSVGIFPLRSWGDMLPLLGPAVIVLSAGLSARWRDVRWERVSELTVRAVFIVVSALATALLCTWPLWENLLRLTPPVMLMIISTATGAVVLTVLTFWTVPGSFAERFMKRPAPLAGTVFAGVILSVLVNCVIFPQMSLFRTERNFWLNSATVLEQCEPAPEMVMFYRCGIPEKGLYYLALKQRIVSVNSPAEASELLRSCGGKVAVITLCKDEYLDELQQIARSARKNFFAENPLAREELPVAFTAGDSRQQNNAWGIWLFEL